MANRFEEIHAFVHVVEHKSFTQAAERLGIAKSSLSRRVNELEQRLGVQLLQRTTRKLSLTSQGRQFYERAVQILAELEDAEQLISDEQVELKGRIKLALPLTFANRHLSHLLTDFVKRYPQIELLVDLNDRQIDLVEEGFDLAIRIGNLQDSTLIARKLGAIRFVTCASPTYLDSAKPLDHPSDLPSHQGLHYTNASASAIWQYQVDGKFRSFVPQKYLSANNGDFLARAAVDGLGVIKTPEFIVTDLIRRQQLVPLLESFPSPESGLHAVFPPGRHITTRIRVLVDFLRDQLAGDESHPHKSD